MSNAIATLAKYRKRVAALEKQIAKERRKLRALPAKLGYKSTEELIDALKAAAAIRPRRRRKR